MSLRGALTASVSLLALAAATPSFADQIETVVVTGIRGSYDRAIDAKRDATTILDAVSSEDIGKFSDKNVADALQRVPGVNTMSAASGEGGFDENDRVSIRGTNASLTQTLVDGHTIATGDWFILDQYQTIGRSVSYTLLPSEIVDKANVYKSQEADLVEGGVAGMVDIQTRKPLGFDKDLTLEGSAEAAYTTLRGDTTPQVNGLVNWKNDSDTFGVMIQAFYEARNIRRDGQEFLGYTQLEPGSNPGPTDPPLITAHPSLAGVWYPNLVGSALFLQERVRTGGSATMEFKPSSSFDIEVQGFYSHLGASNRNNNFMFWGTKEFQNNLPTSYTVASQGGVRTFVAADFPASSSAPPMVTDFIMRPGGGAETYYLSTDASWNVSQDTLVTVKAGYSHGVGKTNPQSAWEGEIAPTTGAAASLDFTSGVAKVAVPSVDLSNPANLINDWAWGAVSTAIDKEFYGQADIEHQVQYGPINAVKAGVRFAQHSRKNDLWDGGVSYGDTGTDVSTSNYPSDFADAFRIPGMLTDVPQGDPALIQKYLDTHMGWRSYTQSAADVSNPAHHRYDWQGSMNMSENDFAAYIMAKIGGEHWNGNFGVRVVNTAEDINLYVNDPTGLPSDFGPYGVSKIKPSFWDILPSANINIDLNDEMKLRFAAAETMSRPDYSALGGAVQLTDLTLTGSGGNPHLRPVKSANYNVSYEWYYAPQSLFSVGLFYMDLSNYVSFGTAQATYVNQLLTGSGPPVYSTYNITSPINSSGHDEGVELSLQQPVWGGFGFSANYTYANGVDNGGGPLVGDSKDTANLTVYYENEWLSTHLSYNYRSKMLVGLDRSSQENENAYDTLDASVNITLTDWAQLDFSALNITNRTLRYYAINTQQPRALYSNGTQLFAGIRLNN